MNSTIKHSSSTSISTSHATSRSPSVQLGIDRILSEESFKKELDGKRLALVAHPASVTSQALTHSLNALIQAGFNIQSAYGPQHGMRGEKQDNMVESEEYLDPLFKIPVFSLYGNFRKPTPESLKTFDVCLFDLQDIGTRIYTFLTTLRYMMEACDLHQKELWLLDRPNPAGRAIEGTRLRPTWESFVGAESFPMRHGLTLGECALWLKDKLNLQNLNLKVIAMNNYFPDKEPHFGWPQELSWVNPSPNAASVNMPHIFPGTVLLEGTTLSEGRGTTRPLELLGAPDINILDLLNKMEKMAPQWMQGALIRPCYFEPTFHKHKHLLNQGFQVHLDHPSYNPLLFKPYRLVALFFKVLRLEVPNYAIWRKFDYEYETDRLAIDLINGSPLLREWVDDSNATVSDFEILNKKDELEWAEEIKSYLLY